MQLACALKGGLLSIATQELLLALQPSPLALTTASRPGIPAVAELARGPGPEDVEHEGKHWKGKREEKEGGGCNTPDVIYHICIPTLAIFSSKL